METALRFYGNRINPRASPILADSHDIFQSHLLFPGKLCLLQFNEDGQSVSYLAISDSGHHRVLIASLQGTIKVREDLIRKTYRVYVICEQFIIGGPIAGFSDGNFTTASFRSPQGLAFHPPNRLYVADTGNHAVRLVIKYPIFSN